MKSPLSRVVLITGAASGIGKSLALSLCREGHLVAAVDRDATGLACLSEEARQTCGERLKTFAVDLSQDNVEDLLGAVQARCGAVEVLINNAGIGQGQIKSDYHVRSPRFYEVSDALVSPVE